MISTLLSVIIALVFISAIFTIPIICAKYNAPVVIIPLLDARRFNKMKPLQQRDYLIKKYLTSDEIRRLVRGGWRIAFKGFNSNMTCMNDFKYRESKTYTCEGEPVLCANGFHACLLPKDVVNYYNDMGNKYHMVFLKDVTSRDRWSGQSSRDSKVCAKTIKIGPRIDSRYITE